MSTRLTELRQWAAREAVPDKPWAEKHIYSADCPWCGQASHELALLLLDVVDAAAKWSEHLGSIEGVGRVAWNQLLDALERVGAGE